MKKSEMIRLLVETMGTYESWKKQCEYMLEVIEDAGMLPPINKGKSVDSHQDSRIIFTVHEWEPE